MYTLNQYFLCSSNNKIEDLLTLHIGQELNDLK